MEKVSTIGIDLAKHVFQLHGAASDGTVVFRRRLRREKVLEFLARPAWWRWKPVQVPTIGVGRSVVSATRFA